ncbi:MAG: ComEC family competence protein, partial [Thermodesulfobacteriota bacterium]
MSRPIIPPLLALMAGITCSSLLTIPDLPVQAFLAFVLLILLVRMKGGRRILSPCLLLSFFLAGILAMNRDLHPYRGGDHIINFVGNEKINIEGMIYDNPEVMHDRMAFVLSVSRVLREGVYAPASGRLLVSMREPDVLRYGDVVRITTRLRLPHSFQNPGGFDYERHLRFRGILVRGFVNDPTGLVILRRDKGNPLRAALEGFRSRLRQSILKTAPATEGSIIRAMLLGDQKGIPKETMDLFNRTGTTHIIAISGFNIGIVAVFSLFVVRLFLKSSEYLLLRWNLHVIPMVSAIVVVGLYTLIAGSGISVVRASIMVVLFMVAILINRERDLYNTLALAAFLILI